MPRQNTSPADYPQAVLLQIEQLAQNIAIARKRRGETQAQWAKKLGVSQPTFARIERGDPGVAMASYVMCMWLVNPAVKLADLVSPLNDHGALEREVSKVNRTRKAPGPKRSGSAFDLPQPRAALAQEPLVMGVTFATSAVSEPAATKAVVRTEVKSNATAQGLAALLKPEAQKP